MRSFWIYTAALLTLGLGAFAMARYLNAERGKPLKLVQGNLFKLPIFSIETSTFSVQSSSETISQASKDKEEKKRKRLQARAKATSASVAPTLKEVSPPAPTVFELLRLIRNDIQRITVNFNVTKDDLTWGVRLVSPKSGIEVWVKNSKDALKTYYKPRISFGETQSLFEGTVLKPGIQYFGAIPADYLRGVSRIRLEATAAGAEPVYMEVKLEWP